MTAMTRSSLLDYSGSVPRLVASFAKAVRPGPLFCDGDHSRYGREAAEPPASRPRRWWCGCKIERDEDRFLDRCLSIVAARLGWSRTGATRPAYRFHAATNRPDR